MDRGYVKLWRKTLDSAVMEHESALYLFVWLLLRVSRQPKVIWDRHRLPAGHYVTSSRKLGKEIGWDKAKVNRVLGILDDIGVIDRLTQRNETAIVVRNWPIYQGEDDPTDGVRKNETPEPGCTRQ